MANASLRDETRQLANDVSQEEAKASEHDSGDKAQSGSPELVVFGPVARTFPARCVDDPTAFRPATWLRSGWPLARRQDARLPEARSERVCVHPPVAGRQGVGAPRRCRAMRRSNSQDRCRRATVNDASTAGTRRVCASQPPRGWRRLGEVCGSLRSVACLRGGGEHLGKPTRAATEDMMGSALFSRIQCCKPGC